MTSLDTLHFLQIRIIASIAKSNGRRFSEIDGFDNIPWDQLNYHLKTLIKLGVKEKNDKLYTLSLEGKQIVSTLDLETGKKELIPKTSIWTIIRNKEDKSKVLISKRLKHPFLGMYGFITGKVRMGELVADTMRREVLEETGLTVLKFELKKIDRFIDYDKKTNSLVHDSFFHKFEVTDYTGNLIAKTLESENTWMVEDEIKMLEEKLAPSVIDHYNSSQDEGKTVLIQERKVVVHNF
jgi:ADP-ribose pyrophosphatase YjhB (NUDIX family)